MDFGPEPYIIKEGLPFIALSAFLALFAAASRLHGLGWILLVLTFLIAAFFRNPVRIIPADPQAIVSPADGKIIEIKKIENKKDDSRDLIAAPFWKISIFMSPFDVHVNRMPLSGKLIHKAHHPGKFYVASQPKASLDNERMETVFEADQGVPLGMVQIAGRLARRIICYPVSGDHLDKGERFGLIRFGSRVELYLPEKIPLTIQEGQRVKGGETIMGYIP
jgi:phosphatidylserine decarboxylase